MVVGSSTITPQTCISWAGVSRYKKLASSPDKRSIVPSPSVGAPRADLNEPDPAATRVTRLAPPFSSTLQHPAAPGSTFVVMGFLRRQLVTAALTGNAIRPVPGFRASIPAFVAGWLTSELVPQLTALTAA